MDKKAIHSLRELADYIRLHEKKVTPIDQNDDYLSFLAGGQWKFELASIDHLVQQKFMTSSEDDLDLVIQSHDQTIPLSLMTDETLIDINLRADSRNKALSKLAKMASAARIASSYEEMYLELESREKFLSTAIGQGVAIPHSRFPHQMIYRHPKLIVARSAAGVDFGAPDKKKVHLFFLPCAPTQFIHLRMMAQIVRMLRVPKVIERLKNAGNKADFLEVIRASEKCGG